MACKMCEERGKTWNGSDPTCAFESPIFSNDNWNCATMNALRDLSEKFSDSWRSYTCRDDMDSASVGVLHTNDGYLVMTWYKQRGKTGRAYIVQDDYDVNYLTISVAEDIIKQYELIPKEVE